MCGIAGVIGYKRNFKPNLESIKKMCSVMIHRGPDDEGYFIKENIGLGMRRLSIIDLESGAQPISK